MGSGKWGLLEWSGQKLSMAFYIREAVCVSMHWSLSRTLAVLSDVSLLVSVAASNVKNNSKGSFQRSVS